MASRNDWFSKHKAIEMIIATKNISACVRVTRARDRARERESNCVLLRHNVHYSLSEDTDRDHVFAFHRFSPENRGVKFSTMNKFQSIYLSIYLSIRAEFLKPL